MELQNYVLFLDDERFPGSGLSAEVVITAKDFWAFKRTINEHGVPKHVCFDHDLGDSKYNGKHCAEYLVCFFFDNPELAKDFTYSIHSQNPIGAENIRSFLESALIEFRSYAK